MRLTLQTDFAIRVLIYTGVNSAKRTTIREVSERYHISENHLMKVVNKLTSMGCLVALRGRSGGIRLSPTVLDMRLGDLIKALETEIVLVPCMHPGDDCVIRRACGFRTAMDEAADAFFESLNRHRFGDLVASENSLQKALRISVDPSERDLEA